MPLFNAFAIELPTSSTINGADINASAESVTLLEANPDRKGASIYNNGTGTLYVELDSPASPIAGFTAKVKPDGYYEVPYGYTGSVEGIWTSPDGKARVREFV